MTTPINQLTDHTDNINQEMLQDDCNSQIVNEILQEMNQPEGTEQPTVDENMYMNQQQEQLNRQMDPVVQLAQNECNQSTLYEESMEKGRTVQEGVQKKLMDTLKEPLMVVCLVFLLHSPIVTSMLVKYLPTLFSSGVNKSVQWLSIFLKSLIVGVAFFALKTML